MKGLSTCVMSSNPTTRSDTPDPTLKRTEHSQGVMRRGLKVAALLVGIGALAFFVLPFPYLSVRYRMTSDCVDCGYESHVYSGGVTPSLYFLKCGLAYFPTLTALTYNYEPGPYLLAGENTTSLPALDWVCGY